MITVGISMVKDEADIVGLTVAHMLDEVDAVIVADNGSTDGTRDVLEDLRCQHSGRLIIRDDPEVAYYQSQKMTALAASAALVQEADWVVPFDADEIWYSPFGRIGDVLEKHAEEYSVVLATLYDHVATGVDPASDPVHRMGWRRVTPAVLPKVAARTTLPVTIEQGNHGAGYPLRATTTPDVAPLVVRHFPYRSAEQFVHKVRNGAAAYAATDLPISTGKHWRSYGQILEHQGEEAVGDIFREWFWHADPSGDPTLVFDPAPIT